jgi:hypothetical protein
VLAQDLKKVFKVGECVLPFVVKRPSAILRIAGFGGANMSRVNLICPLINCLFDRLVSKGKKVARALKCFLDKVFDDRCS